MIFSDAFVMTKRLLKEQFHEKQETIPFSEMWINPCLGRAVFYRQAHKQPFANQLSHKDKMKKWAKLANFP
jgi:hypothetical protein